MRLHVKRALAQFSPIFTSIVNASDNALVISEDLFAVEKLFAENTPLLRAVTDPSRSAGDKVSFVEKLLSDSINKASVQILCALAELRWTKDADLLEALETLGIEAIMLYAESEDKLHKVQSDLFAVIGTLKKNPSLRNTLTDLRTYSVKDRVNLVDKVFASEIDALSVLMLKRAVVHTKRAGLSVYIRGLAELVAGHANHLLAVVTVVAPMTEQQKVRLESILQKAYGKQVIINEVIDKELIGGIRIRIGQTMIDGSLLSSMEQARQRLAS
ncbi:F0F1 ATP synthase subunit delta [Actinomyces sp. zg-332]|uniref:F0F1 ATP synthase subunit delta n=1 Tax=Actinomyces sp. zg-332 TaxID=2708340 RepID=UPI001421FFDF|nr:F0F1 ATP synthase subunit delta [Actinomyces sp. zg-332]QPK94502.1 F0F1 ATP synthase subunit delta [Actinomyces sp. zg-332]